MVSTSSVAIAAPVVNSCWSWEMQGKAAGTFSVNESINVDGTAPAGTYTLTDFRVLSSIFPAVEAGSIDNGTYAFGFQPPYSFIWNGTAPTVFQRMGATNGFGIYNGTGGNGAYLTFDIGNSSISTGYFGTGLYSSSTTPSLTPTSLSACTSSTLTFNCPGGGTYSVVYGVIKDLSLYSGNCSGNVVLDSYVKQIDYASDVSNLVTSITIPATTIKIESQPFTLGNSLAAITVDPANLNYKSVNDVLFNKDGTTLIQYPQVKAGSSYTVPAGVTKIEIYAFSCAANLSTLTIPDGVVTAGYIDRPNGCQGNNLSAFIVGAGNANYAAVDGVLYNKNLTTIFAYPLGKSGSSYVMPNTVTSITGSALGYSNNHELRTITLSSNLTTIGTYSFESLNLATLNLPASLTTISNSGLFNVGAITVDAANANFSEENGVLFNKNKTTLIYYPTLKSSTNYTIPDSVTSLSVNSFYSGNSFLKRLSIGGNLISVGNFSNFPNTLKYLLITGDTTADFANLYLGNLVAVNYCGSNATTLNNINSKLASWNNATLTCVTPPNIALSSSSETVTRGSAISGFTINSSGGAVATYSISPEISDYTPGLAFNTSTGLITGTPTTVATARTYTITAENVANSTTQTFSITVLAPPPPAFTLSSLAESVTTGSALSGYTITSTGGTITSYSISPAISNTPGLAFSTSTGLITGTPTTVATARTYTITASNGDGNTATRTFALTVLAPPPPVPTPYLKTITSPKINLVNGLLVCSAGTYQAGYSVGEDVSINPALAFTSGSYTYKLLSNGLVQSAATQTTSGKTASWSTSLLAKNVVASCMVTVTANGITVDSRSTDNTSGTGTALSVQSQSISTAEVAYTAALSLNSKAYQKALVDNRANWRKEIEAIRANYYDTISRINSTGGTRKMITDKSTALKVMIAANKKSASDYKASQPAALAAKEAANKAALAAKDAANTKANATYGSYIESIGYGVLIP